MVPPRTELRSMSLRKSIPTTTGHSTIRFWEPWKRYRPIRPKSTATAPSADTFRGPPGRKSFPARPQNDEVRAPSLLPARMLIRAGCRHQWAGSRRGTPNFVTGVTVFVTRAGDGAAGFRPRFTCQVAATRLRGAGNPGLSTSQLILARLLLDCTHKTISGCRSGFHFFLGEWS